MKLPARRPFGRYLSVRARIMMWTIFTVTLLLVMLGGIVQYTAQSLLIASVDRDLTNRSKWFMNSPPLRNADNRRPPGGPRDRGQRRPSAGPSSTMAFRDRSSIALRSDIARRLGTNFFPRTLDLNGKDMFVPDITLLDMPALQRAALGRNDYTTITFDDQPVRLLSAPIRREGKIIGVVQVPHPLADTYRAIAGMQRTMLLLIPVAFLLAGVGGAIITGRALRPVRDIVTTAEQIGGHDLASRLEVAGHDEFSHLAATFNSMLERLESAFSKERSLVRQLGISLEQQQRFTADASHELKTPLTIAKVNTGLLLANAKDPEDRESLEDIDRSLELMDRLVQDLLLLARNDAEVAPRAATDILVRDILQQARCSRTSHNGRSITIDVPDPELTVYGNEMELVRAFSNLMENALAHTPPDGDVRAKASVEGDAVAIRVIDTGTGIAPEHLPHLGERFYRVDAARSRPDGGTGLGLSICLSIVENHGGTIQFASVLGEGTTVTVLLPRKNNT